jgi:tight adherence protein C
MAVLSGFLLAFSFASFAKVFGRSRARSLSDRLSPQAQRVNIFRPFFDSISARISTFSVSKRQMRSALFELPDFLDMLALALAAGDGIFTAIARVTPRASGVLAEHFSTLMQGLELGGEFEVEIRELARRIPQRQVSEFCTKLVLSIKRGSPLATLLREQSQSARTEIRADLLRQAARNETRMLIPLVFLILPVTVLFAVYPSLQLLRINYV